MQCRFLYFSAPGQIFHALAADILTPEGYQSPGGTTESTGRFKLLQDDFTVVDKNLHLITNLNIQSSAQFDGQNDSSKLIHFTNMHPQKLVERVTLNAIL